MPPWLSPGLLILWIPIGFRATCYYYRKAYYRFYFADPPGCAVGEPTDPPEVRAGERLSVHPPEPPPLPAVPGVHPARVPVVRPPAGLHLAPTRRSPTRARGSASAASSSCVNVILLTGYSLSCHSLRHLVGGRIDCFSCTAARRVRYTLWQRLTDLNRNHMWWAWTSLITVTLADVYVRLLGARGGHRPRDPLLGAGRGMAWPRPRRRSTRSRRIPSTSSSSARAAPACGRRSRPRPPARASASSASRCSARHTRSWPRAASRRRSPTWTPTTRGRPTSATRWSAASCSTTRAWPSSTPRRRRTASASSSSGAPSSTGPATGASSSGRSAATPTPASPTSATAPGWR